MPLSQLAQSDDFLYRGRRISFEMSKLINIGFAIALLAIQLQKCTSSLGGALLGHASSVVTVGTFLDDMTRQLFAGPTAMDETLHAISEMHSEVVNDLDNISEMLEKLPDMIDIALKKYNLGEKMYKLKVIFQEAAAIKLKVEQKQIEDKRIYEDFGKKMSNLDAYFSTIDYIISTDLKSISDLMVNGSNTELQAYKSFCDTGISQFQLLDNLFRLLRISIAQYFITKTLMYNFLDIHNKNPIYAVRKDALKDNINIIYKSAVTTLKSAMPSASRELWTCDPKEHIEIETYVHLNAFSQYILNEQYALEPYSVSCYEASCPTIKRLDNNNRIFDLHKNTRPCWNGFASCQDMTGSLKDYVVCVNKSPTSAARYTGIIEDDEEKLRNFYCSPGNRITKISTVSHSYANIVAPTCDYCNCICKELDYYVSLDPALASVEENRVVTGASLAMMNDNNLFIQIQQGELLANGSINSSTVVWKIRGIEERVKVSWNELRSFDLTQTILPGDRILTGLKFEVNSTSKRISLASYSAGFDFRTGKLIDDTEDQQKLHIPKPAEKELWLSNLDVPTRSNSGKNYPNSKNNQFLKLTTSSLEKDGGQTTIPFIDFQTSTSKYLTPLSGAGLVHRAQKGYGGFLGLKLYNYDMNPYIEDRINLNELDSVLETLKV